MDDMCTDNRFELIERFKKKLIESTNIETSPEEMKAIDNLLFRFWQMGWLDIIDRMLLVKESAKTLMHSVGNSVSAKAFRNAGRFIQNAIDGEAPEFEKIPSAQPTLYGYDIKHLMLIADVLRKENLPPERVTEALMDIGRIVSIVRDEFEESLREAMKQCKI